MSLPNSITTPIEFSFTLMMDSVLTSSMSQLTTSIKTMKPRRSLKNTLIYYRNSTPGLMPLLREEMDSTSSRIPESFFEKDFESQRN